MRPTTTSAGAAAALLVLVLALASCGSDDDPATIPPATQQLVRQAKQPGEVVLRGEASPRVHGPVTLHGVYRVRFEQVAPEDPTLDFAAETPFVVRLQPEQGAGGRTLFKAAAATGQRTIALDGRYLVDVSFGDYPYAIRFTPLRR